MSCAPVIVPALHASVFIGVGGIAQSVAEEVERQHGDDHRERRAGSSQGAWRRRGCSAPPAAARPSSRPAACSPMPRKHSAVSARIIAGIASVSDGDDVAHERGHHVPPDDAASRAAVEPGGDDEVLVAQRQESAAHDARQVGPADQRQDHGDRRNRRASGRPVGRHGRRQAHPERDGRDRLQELDDALDDVVDPAADIARRCRRAGCRGTG